VRLLRSYCHECWWRQHPDRKNHLIATLSPVVFRVAVSWSLLSARWFSEWRFLPAGTARVAKQQASASTMFRPAIRAPARGFWHSRRRFRGRFSCIRVCDPISMMSRCVRVSTMARRVASCAPVAWSASAWTKRTNAPRNMPHSPMVVQREMAAIERRAADIAARKKRLEPQSPHPPTRCYSGGPQPHATRRASGP
jgi:hypothetical protein